MIFALIPAALVIGIGYVAYRTPKLLKVSRTLTISASAEKLFPYINRPELIQKWNPFVDSDPSATSEFHGPAEGVGAAWSYKGKTAGVGRVTIKESDPLKRVGLKLDFEKPFKATNDGEYTLTPRGANSCDVTWTVNESNLVPRLMSAVMNFDKFLGTFFEKGLAKLKTIAETP